MKNFLKCVVGGAATALGWYIGVECYTAVSETFRDPVKKAKIKKGFKNIKESFTKED